MLAALSTQVYISVQNDKLSDPYAEQYYLTLNNSQGTPINWTAQAASVGTFDKGVGDHDNGTKSNHGGSLVSVS